jgi:hypothetical protein
MESAIERGICQFGESKNVESERGATGLCRPHVVALTDVVSALADRSPEDPKFEPLLESQ